MVYVVKSTRNFKIFGAQPWPGNFMKTATVSTENSKAEMILASCVIFGPASAVLRIMFLQA